VAALGFGQHLHRGDEEAVGLREPGRRRERSSISMLKGRSCGYMRAKKRSIYKFTNDSNILAGLRE